MSNKELNDNLNEEPFDNLIDLMRYVNDDDDDVDGDGDDDGEMGETHQ